jgi:hypothetical protein
VADASGEVVPMVRAAFTGKVKLPVAVLLNVSVTVAENVTGPAVGGVPLRNPPDVSINQLGRFEEVQVYDPEPPEAANCCE